MLYEIIMHARVNTDSLLIVVVAIAVTFSSHGLFLLTWTAINLLETFLLWKITVHVFSAL